MPYYNRKNPRLPNYDYSENGVYFITICTHHHKYLLSQILGTVSELSEYGIIAENVIRLLPQRFDITIDKYVVMPNHIHMLLRIDGFRTIQESSLQGRSVISKVVGYLKMNVSKYMHQMGYQGEVWQRSFHDHIIRNQKSYEKIWLYIEDNPRKWEEDCFHYGMNNGKG